LKLKYGPYSPSRLDTATCGYAFKRQYIDKDQRAIVRTENLPQARGSAVHEVLEKMTKQMATEPDRGFNEQQLRSWVTEAVIAHPAAYQDVEDILGMVRLYARKPPPVLTENAKTEIKLGITGDGKGGFHDCHYDDPDVWFRGRADIMLVNDGLTSALVYDHKTQPNVEEGDTPQMGFYAWVIARSMSFLQEIKTSLHFVRYGKYADEVLWDEARIHGEEDRILTQVAIIENRTTWEATPHKGCQYCPFVSECPALREFIEVDSRSGDYRVRNDNLKILGDTNKAVKLAGLLNVMEEAVTRGKKELKEFVKFAGSGIAIPGKVFEFRASEEKVDWDKVNKKHDLKTAAYAIFEKHGIDPRDFMGFSQTFSKHVWIYENEVLLRELSALFPRTRDTEFRGYKV